MAPELGAISPLQDFLFSETQMGGLGFKTQTALATSIHGQNDKIWQRKSLATQLSKTFDFKLELTTKLENALLKLAVGEPRQRLEVAIELHKEEQQRRDDPIGIIRNRYDSAQRVIFLGLEPISAHLDIAPPALVDLFRFSFYEILSGNLTLTMGVPSKEIALGIWKSIATVADDAVKSGSETHSPEELLKIVDKKLTLLQMPRRMCVHTTFVFDPDLPICTGYTWYLPWGWRAPAKMPPLALQAWKDEYLSVLDDPKHKGEKVTVVPRP